jgi:hypothetical protein
VGPGVLAVLDFLVDPEHLAVLVILGYLMDLDYPVYQYFPAYLVYQEDP